MVPDKVLEHFTMLAELGAEQLVTRKMADPDIVGELCEDNDSGWSMEQCTAEDWMATYKDGTSGWILKCQCDYKHFWIFVKAPTWSGNFLFSIKNETVELPCQNDECRMLHAVCEKTVSNEKTIVRILRENPNANVNVVRLMFASL